MRRAEKICRSIKCCRIPFSPEAAIWIHQVQVYYSLLRYHKEKIKNRRKVKCAAWGCNIPNPLQLLIQEITHRLEACKKDCIFYQEHGKRFQRKHLKNQRRLPRSKKMRKHSTRSAPLFNENIEHQQDFWRKLNYVTGKKKTHSATTIQVEGGDRAIMERNTQDTVEQFIFREVHEKCYTLTGEAPICNGTLFQEFGYTASTPASKAVLDGTYVAPADSDGATRSSLQRLQLFRN